MPHLLRIRRLGQAPAKNAPFPFSVPAVRTTPAFEFTSAVTFFVGENGSGKSTVLEAIALAAGLPAVGAADPRRDETLAPQRELARAYRLEWSRRTHRGFFLRAEDFFGFQRRLARERVELEARITEVEATYQDRSALARGLAKGPAAASLAAMERRYGRDPEARSHGEAFLALFKSRFVPGGLFLLDEPEAPLSPQNQLGLVALLMDLVTEDAQFIVATHSPIVLGVPGATILSFDGGRVAPVAYQDTAHVRLTRDFLNAPERYLRRLAAE